MRITVELDQTEIIKAIRLYLEQNSVPTGQGPIGNGTRFPIDIYFKDGKVEQTAALRMVMTFEAENFSSGPYR